MISPNNGSFDSTMKKPGISVINHRCAPDKPVPGACEYDENQKQDDSGHPRE
jgi:hypothetical protein